MKSRFKLIAIFAIVALIAAACGDDDGGEDTTTTTADTTTTTGGDGTTTTTESMGVLTDVGVTEEPCTNGNPDRGCIILGAITDQTGSFSAASPGLIAGHQAFWAGVNAAGGIGGEYDVELRNDLIVNNNFTAATHVEVYQEIRDENMLALAESLGSAPTLQALPDYEEDNMVGAAMTWWSGWGYEDQDAGLIIETGASYCVEAANALDWGLGAFAGLPQLPDGIQTVGVVHFPGDYGEDYLQGVINAAEANGLTVVFTQRTLPIALDGTQTEAINAVVEGNADITFLATGPFEAGPIVGNALNRGHQKPIIGSAPTWNPALLVSNAGPAFTSGLYFQSSPVANWTYESAGHTAMRAAGEALGIPPNFFFLAGWTSQYGLKAALEQAFAAGDLTREGLANATRSLGEVDYEGMLPTIPDFANDPFVKGTFIHAVDAEAADGLSVVGDFVTGPTVEGYAFDEACVQITG